MEAAKRIIVLAAIVCCLAIPAHTGEQEKAPKTLTASCLVRITANPAIFPLSDEAVLYLLLSSSVLEKAAVDTLPGVDPLEAQSFIEIEGLPDSPAERSLGGTPAPALPRATSRYQAPTTTSASRSSRSRSAGTRTGTRSVAETPAEAKYGDPMAGATTSTAPSRPTGTTTRRSTSSSASAATPAFPGGSVLYGSSRAPYSDSSRNPYSPTGRTAGTYTYNIYGGKRSAQVGRSTTSASRQKASPEQSMLFRLTVNLAEDVPDPKPKEFMKAVLRNLRDVLETAFSDHYGTLKNELEAAQFQRDNTLKQLSEVIGQAQQRDPAQAIGLPPEDVAVNEQLDQIVDLSALSPEMSLAEAIDLLKNSVDPPLKIVVLWRDLYDNAELEPTTEIIMDGLSEVHLGRALKLLLKAVSGVVDEVGYSITDGVITVASEWSLPRNMVTRVYEIPGLAYSGSSPGELAYVIMETIEPDSWFEIGRGEGAIAPYLGSKLAVRQTPQVHQKIRQFLQTVKTDAPVGIPLDIPAETLFYEKLELQREKRRLEMDLARLNARQTAIQQEIAKITTEVADKLGADYVTVELERIIEINANQLAAIAKRVESGTAASTDLGLMREKLARARIELARRREELNKSAGGDQLTRLNNELSSLAIDLSERTAELQVLNTQLRQTESQLALATTFDPRVSQLRLIREAFETAERRIGQLRARIAGLTPPVVTVLGAD